MTKDQIKARYGILLHAHRNVVAALGNDDPRATELLGMVGELIKGAEWTGERPTAGKWWVAIHPNCRHVKPGNDGVFRCVVDPIGYASWAPGSPQDHLPLTARYFTGALWLPRENPADPFAAREG